jgi:ATP-dependent DNA ligase
MLAKVADEIPAGDYLYEPKWDGFRALAFRGAGDEVFLQSRDLKPLDRYFPDLHEALADALPPECIVDGEIVIAGPGGLDFDALQLRLHPAASRVAKLVAAQPASFVAFDLLRVGGRDVMAEPQAKRRARLEKLLARAKPPLYLTPATRSRDEALDWLHRFEGAGLDGVVAKPESAAYQPGVRAMIKVKHVRTADCVVVGFRWHKAGEGYVGSLLLGLYDDAGALHHVGVTSSFTMARRQELAKLFLPLRTSSRVPGSASRWNAGKDASWEEVRPERVCEVKYDHLQGDRFRHAAIFLRWRPDKPPEACRYDQLEVTAPYELAKVLGANSSPPSARGGAADRARRPAPPARAARRA